MAKFVTESVLLGTITLEQLENLNRGNSSNGHSIKFTWETDIQDFLQMCKTRSSGNKENYGKESIYNIAGLGTFKLEPADRMDAVVTGIVQNSLVTSFQVRIRKTLSEMPEPKSIGNILGDVHAQVMSLTHLLSEGGLFVTDCVSTLRDVPQSEVKASEILTSASPYIGNVFSASLNGEAVIIKRRDESFNHYFIINHADPQLALDFYFLRIAKEKLKNIIVSLRHFHENELQELSRIVQAYTISTEANRFNVTTFLRLRKNTISLLNRIRLVKRELEATLSFVRAYLDHLFSTPENSIEGTEYKVIQQEREEFDFYYRVPVEALLSDAENDVIDIRDHLTELSEIYSVLTNVKSQRIIMIFTLVLSVLGVFTLIVTLFRL